jgi:hypothetical protein
MLHFIRALTFPHKFKERQLKVTINRSAFILAAIFLLAAMTAACQKAAESNANSNRSASNTAASNTTAPPAANSSPTEAPRTSESPAAASGSLATPTDTYKTGYTARKNKDIEALKRVLSKEALDFLTEMGKEEKKTLDDQLKALADRPQADKAETRNEKIDGDTATLEYLNERGTWSKMDFVKEGNDWKIGFPKAP